MLILVAQGLVIEVAHVGIRKEHPIKTKINFLLGLEVHRKITKLRVYWIMDMYLMELKIREISWAHASGLPKEFSPFAEP